MLNYDYLFISDPLIFSMHESMPALCSNCSSIDHSVGWFRRLKKYKRKATSNDSVIELVNPKVEPHFGHLKRKNTQQSKANNMIGLHEDL